MLILARKEEETIVIRAGETEIKLIVASIDGNRVRLGFEAPREVIINRLEIQEELDRDSAKQLDS